MILISTKGATDVLVMNYGCFLLERYFSIILATRSTDMGCGIVSVSFHFLFMGHSLILLFIFPVLFVFRYVFNFCLLDDIHHLH